MREHLLAIQKRTGRTPAALENAAKCPPGCEGLWRDFLAMHACRGSTGFGPARLSFMDIDAYQRVMRVTFDPWEVEALRRADGVYMAQQAEARRKPSG